MMRSPIIILCLITNHIVQCGDIETIKDRAHALKEQEQFEEAFELYAQCYSSNTYDIHSKFHAALCLLNIGRVSEAIALFESICPYVQDPLPIRYNIAYAYKTDGMLERAISIYEDIIAQNPLYDDAHLGLGFAYLQYGDFVHGWKQHTRFLKKTGRYSEELHTLIENNDLTNKKIILHYEGGLGDTLLFIRYAERLKQLGAHTICMVQKPLIPLLSRCPYIDTLLPYQLPLPPHDARISLMSLPAIFEDTEDSFPVSIPYIYPDPVLVEAWAPHINNHKGLKIGITWQSDVHNDVSRMPIARRGIPLKLFEPLLCNPRYTFFSLQRFEGTEQIAELDPMCRLIHYPDLDTEHGPFMDTAAIIQNLDLVIAVDSAIANISGALGIPTLLLLPYATDWRWIADRTDTPWYPHHRLIKQPKPFDWNSVVDEVRSYLESLYLKKRILDETGLFNDYTPV